MSSSESQMSKVKFKLTDHAAEELAVPGTRQTVPTDRIGGYPSRAASMTRRAVPTASFAEIQQILIVIVPVQQVQRIMLA